MAKQDLEFIAQTIQAILSNKVNDTDTINKIIGNANQYSQVKKFPVNKEDWSDEQLNSYFGFLEKLVDMPVEYSQAEFDNMDVIKKVETIMGEVEDLTPGIETAGAMVQGVVDKLEEKKKYRDDLKCPYCTAMVYDNRNNKKADKSPDFVCSTNDPAVCGGHTGKWRKSWWLDNNDVPEDWNISAEL